jgi:hypothetical protein
VGTNQAIDNTILMKSSNPNNTACYIIDLVIHENLSNDKFWTPVITKTEKVKYHDIGVNVYCGNTVPTTKVYIKSDGSNHSAGGPANFDTRFSEYAISISHWTKSEIISIIPINKNTTNPSLTISKIDSYAETVFNNITDTIDDYRITDVKAVAAWNVKAYNGYLNDYILLIATTKGLFIASLDTTLPQGSSLYEPYKVTDKNSGEMITNRPNNFKISTIITGLYIDRIFSFDIKTGDFKIVIGECIYEGNVLHANSFTLYSSIDNIKVYSDIAYSNVTRLIVPSDYSIQISPGSFKCTGRIESPTLYNILQRINILERKLVDN